MNALPALFVVVSVASVVGLFAWVSHRPYFWIWHRYEPLTAPPSRGRLAWVAGLGVFVGVACSTVLSGVLVPAALAASSSVLFLAADTDVRERRVPAPPLWLAAAWGAAAWALTPGDLITAFIPMVMAVVYFVFALTGHAGASDYRLWVAIAPAAGFLSLVASMALAVVFAVAYVVFAVVARRRGAGVPVAVPVHLAWAAAITATLLIPAGL